MKFKFLGTQIYISFFFCAVFVIMLATDRTGLILPTFFAIIMHEIGHLFTMWALDCSPKQIRLIPASIQIVSSFSKGYKNDVIIAVSGPITNFVLFGTLYFNYLCFQNELTLYFALLNLVVGIFNSLPVLGLDGGTVLFSVLAKKNDLSRATVILKIVSIIIALLIIGVAVVISLNGKSNISIYIIGIYLFVLTIIK